MQRMYSHILIVIKLFVAIDTNQFNYINKVIYVKINK